VTKALCSEKSKQRIKRESKFIPEELTFSFSEREAFVGKDSIVYKRRKQEFGGENVAFSQQRS